MDCCKRDAAVPFQHFSRSGYTEKVRRDTAIAAFKGIEKKVKEAKEEEKPLHRHKEDSARDRFKRKVSLKSSWFNKKRNKANNNAKNKANVVTNNKPKAKYNKKPSKPFFPNKPKVEQDDREAEPVVFIPYTKNSYLTK